MLKGAEESWMIGGNIDGFISCIERGVRGVRVPAPEINQQSMERKGDKILKTRLASTRPDKSCLIAVFVRNSPWENVSLGGTTAIQ